MPKAAVFHTKRYYFNENCLKKNRKEKIQVTASYTGSKTTRVGTFKE